jgi:nitrate/nitrite transporter NarK
VWLLSSILFMHSMVTYGMFLWLPKLLRDASGLKGFALSSITSFPFVVALVAMVVIGRHSDRTAERRLHVAGCATTAALGLLLAVASEGRLWLVVLAFTLAQIGNRGFTGVFWALPPMFLAGSAAAGGLALINAVGNLGGFAGPAMMGVLRDLTGSYNGGLLVLVAALLTQVLLVLALKLPPRVGSEESSTSVRPEVSA